MEEPYGRGGYIKAKGLDTESTSLHFLVQRYEFYGKIFFEKFGCDEPFEGYKLEFNF